MEDVGTYVYFTYGHLVCFTAIRYILWLFGIFFPRFGRVCQEKSGNPGKDQISSSK
jgi:hypothetical protein